MPEPLDEGRVWTLDAKHADYIYIRVYALGDRTDKLVIYLDASGHYRIKALARGDGFMSGPVLADGVLEDA